MCHLNALITKNYENIFWIRNYTFEGSGVNSIELVKMYKKVNIKLEKYKILT